MGKMKEYKNFTTSTKFKSYLQERGFSVTFNVFQILLIIFFCFIYSFGSDTCSISQRQSKNTKILQG